MTRDPVFAGAGMSDGLAKRCGIDKEAPARTGVPTGMVVKMEPEFKREMRRYCSDMCVTPNGLVTCSWGRSPSSCACRSTTEGSAPPRIAPPAPKGADGKPGAIPALPR